ncbi:Leucine aminopeptidase 2 [Musa troglodytarum]|uniref:Leucine aminopeptidase 2 n=1 Tax=Musa troglodytarum TaxID=320322 RepID=A0A9E7GIS5_9LILI|nr:Leucine aminopeptidase 2 [Musa troglodytarum]
MQSINGASRVRPMWSSCRFSLSIASLPRLLFLVFCRQLGRMGHSAVAATAALSTLGLTKPADIEIPHITFTAKEMDFSEWKGDLLAVAVSEKDMKKDSDSKFQNVFLKRLDDKIGGLLAEAVTEEDFNGKAGQSTVLRLPGLGFKRLGLVGLGSSSSTVAAYRGIGEAVAGVAKAAQANSVAVCLASSDGISEELKINAASAIASGSFSVGLNCSVLSCLFVLYVEKEGTILGVYEDNRFRSDSKKPLLKTVDIIGFGSGTVVDQKLKYATEVCSGVIFGKDLVNAPANVLTPGALAEEASKIATLYSDVLTATILDAEQCKELKMGSYLAVTAASSNPPHFIHLCYKPPNGDVKRKLAIVGKGLTFDSGGYNIKTGPGCSIETMKVDMGGAAAAFGAAKALAQIKPAGVEVHFMSAACENMISGTGMRPGDIVTASNGKTIEVNNTDAEGRLTLADALVYACNQGIDKVVDLATLTGACIVALGPSIAGFYSPSDDLAKEIVTASEVTGEKFWRMPLEESYWESMKSGVADMVNTGGRQGGSITAALFLKQFVNEKVQWLHIDMAGPVWNDKKRAATGFGMGNTAGMPLQAKSPDPSATTQVLAAAGPTPDSKPKKKICCACPDTKRLRDECIVEHGEASCEKWIQAHLRCLRAEGFKMEVRMTKKMRKIAKEPSPSTSCSSFGDDARQRFKHQSLLQDYMELVKETEAKKKKLQETRLKKLQLLAEVRFLRRKYKTLSENPSQGIPFRLKKQSYRVPSPSPSPSIYVALSMSSLVPNEVPSKGKQYGDLEAASTSNFVESSSVNPFRFKKQSHRNLRSSLCVAQSMDVSIPREVPSQDKKYRVLEAVNTSTSPWFDKNQVSLLNGEEMELQLKQDILKMGKLKRCSMNGGGSNDFKLAMCRDVGNNSNRVSKRKISWQDQVALEV